MYPSQVRKEHIDAYGKPTVKVFELAGRRLEIVNFPVMPTRARLAKEFAVSNVLQEPAAMALYAQLSAKGELQPAEWEQVGLAEKLPESEPLPQEVSDNIARNKAACDFKNVVFDQTTVDTLWSTLTRARDTNLTIPQPVPHTLLMGPPGTSKSKVARMTAAILDRPFYQVNSEQVSPEVIQAQVMGEDVMVGNPWAEAKELVRMGGLREPAARRQYLSLLAQKPIETFSMADYQSLASKEGLEKGTIYKRPGKAYLAKKYGAELNLTEINCLRGDAITLLTGPVLDVYTSDHPNYLVVADANPASDRFSNRFALPPEIIDRFGNPFGVEPLTMQQLTTAIMFGFTGQQPTIKLGASHVIVTAASFGLKVNDKPDLSNLAKMLTPQTLHELAKRVASFHYNLDQKIGEGKLDRRESERPRTAETTTLTRRGLGLFLQGMLANIDAAVPSNPDTIGQPDVKSISAPQAVAAIHQAMIDYYFRPYSFMAEKIQFSVELGPKSIAKPDELFNTREVLMAMQDVAGLTPDKLTSFVETFDGLQRVADEVKLRLTNLAKAAGYAKPLPPGVVKDLEGVLGRITPAEREHLHVALDENKRPLVIFESSNQKLTAQGTLAAILHYHADEPRAMSGQLAAAGAKEFQALVRTLTCQGFVLPNRSDLREKTFQEQYLPQLMEKPACYIIPMMGPALREITEVVDAKEVTRSVNDPSKPEEPVLAVIMHHSFAPSGSPFASGKDEAGGPRPYNMVRVNPRRVDSTKPLEQEVLLMQTLVANKLWDPAKPMIPVLLPLEKRELPVIPGLVQQLSPDL